MVIIFNMVMFCWKWSGVVGCVGIIFVWFVLNLVFLLFFWGYCILVLVVGIDSFNYEFFGVFDGRINFIV